MSGSAATTMPKYCGETNCENTPTQVCSRCKHIRYCGRACQKSNWSVHKRYCTGLASGSLTHYFPRSPRLSASQAKFLASWVVDLSVQNLIPSSTNSDWTIPESLTIAPPTCGVLLSHQPLVDRFRWGQNSTLCQYLTGRQYGYIEIYPSGYDYDLTHTLYYVPPGNPERSVPTSELTIDGVELVGIAQLTKPEMATFLEAVVKPAKLSPAAYIVSVGSRHLDQFIEPQMNRNNSRYMHRPDPAGVEGKERHDFEVLQELRRKGLRLTSPREDWVKECRVDWTEFFFDEKESSVESGEIEYGKGPKFDTAFADYWKYMASKSDS
ncbi:hypothetical protein BJ165DRAFT_1517175 [Panaeolus papilionaceus]|nr:hypothetical protein BJ165DRAFT_1517175 [Panaeolus papilionaceus]